MNGHVPCDRIVRALVQLQFEPQVGNALSESQNGREDHVRVPDGISIVHVEPGCSSAGRELRIQCSHLGVDADAERSGRRSIPLAHALLRPERRLREVTRGEEDRRGRGADSPDHGHQGPQC